MQTNMIEAQVPQQAMASSPSLEQVNVSTHEASSHSQAPLPTFSFDDEPLFGVEGSTLPDDFFSSPEWTDPSPALTTSMSFALDSSCDTSPLLTDNYDAPDYSGIPLFGNFPLNVSYSTESFDRSKRSPQNAFSNVKDANEESAKFILRAFNEHNSFIPADIKKEVKKQESTASLLTASPAAISSPLLASRPVISSFSSYESLVDRPQPSVRGTKRRLDTTDLLPLDAPIQPRTYKTASATSRREKQEFAAEEAEIAAEKDPLVAKRLSNTLAARRSRHRKATELRALNDKIEDLEDQVEMWKRRCQALTSL